MAVLANKSVWSKQLQYKICPGQSCLKQPKNLAENLSDTNVICGLNMVFFIQIYFNKYHQF